MAGTRTVSLGICAVWASMVDDMHCKASGTHRERPFVAAANCTLIARP